MGHQNKIGNRNNSAVCKETRGQGRPLRLSQLWLIVVLGLFIVTSACGKKGPPTLKAYQPPKSVAYLNVIRIDEALTISWDYPLSDRKGLKGFILTRSSRDSELEINLSPDVSEYKDSDLREFETYRYRIRAVNKKGIVGEPSREIEATACPIPLPPTNVGFKVNNDAVELFWVKQEGQATGPCSGPIRYNVYMSDTKGGQGLVPVNDMPLDDNRYKVPVPTEKTVYFIVRAMLNTGFAQIGLPSAEIIVKPTDLVPSAPRIINTATNDGMVFIFWEEAPERWVRGYRVYRQGRYGDFEAVAEVNTPVFTGQLGDEREGIYRVTAIGPVREGPPVEVKVIHDKR